MDTKSNVLKVALCVVFTLFCAFMIGMLLILNIGERKENPEGIAGEGKQDLFASFLSSDYKLSQKEEAVANPEGEAEGLHMDAHLALTDWKKRQDAGLTNLAILNTMKQMEGRYAYDTLSDDLKQLYAEIYLIIGNYATDIPLCCVDFDDVKYVGECVYVDSAEFFYHDGYEYIRDVLGDNVIRIRFKPIYNMSFEQAVELQSVINEYSTNALAGIPFGASEYDKVKYIYEYIYYTTEYDEEASYNQTVCSVALEGKTVCLGYARAFQYLLNEVGVNSSVVIGSVKEGEGHAWNLVKVGGAYYYVDLTMADTSYSDMPGIINYDYMCITTDELLRTHTIESSVPMPRCVFTSACYYNKEGMYIETANHNSYEKVFLNASMMASGSIAVKCADELTYLETKRYLFEEGNVSKYYSFSGSQIYYKENDNLYTFNIIK